MKHLAMAVMAAAATLPQPLLAHGGLDHSSPLMVLLHTLAHVINDQPIILVIVVGALLGAAVVAGMGVYQRRCANRRASP